MGAKQPQLFGLGDRVTWRAQGVTRTGTVVGVVNWTLPSMIKSSWPWPKVEMTSGYAILQEAWKNALKTRGYRPLTLGSRWRDASYPLAYRLSYLIDADGLLAHGTPTATRCRTRRTLRKLYHPHVSQLRPLQGTSPREIA